MWKLNRCHNRTKLLTQILKSNVEFYLLSSKDADIISRNFDVKLRHFSHNIIRIPEFSFSFNFFCNFAIYLSK